MGSFLFSSGDYFMVSIIHIVIIIIIIIIIIIVGLCSIIGSCI